MRSRWLLVWVWIGLLAAACIPRPPPRALEAERIPHDAPPAVATLAATEGLEDAGLDVDARGPTLATTWRSMPRMGTRLAPSRRLAVRVRVDPRAIVVRPIVEECDETGCTSVANLLPDEARLVQHAVESIRARLEVRDAPEVSAIQRQVTRDPSPPTGRGPVAIPTRMGPTEVAAGSEVEAVLVNGGTVSGTVVGVSADGLTLEISPGRELVLWAGDLASLRVE